MHETSSPPATDSESVGAPSTADRVAIAFAVLYPTVLTYVYFVYLTEAEKIVQHVVYGGGKLIQFGLPLFWFAVMQKRRLRIERPPAQGMLASLAFGAAVLAAMWAIYLYLLVPYGMMNAATEQIRIKVSSFGVDGVVSYALLSLFYSLVHSLAEEYYWRWFTFGELRRMVSLPLAIGISSFGFMAHHVIILGTFFGYDQAITWLFSAAIAFGGAVWAWIYHRTGSLYAVWWSHLLVDVGIFTIGYHLVGDLLH